MVPTTRTAIVIVVAVVETSQPTKSVPVVGESPVGSQRRHVRMLCKGLQLWQQRVPASESLIRCCGRVVIESDDPLPLSDDQCFGWVLAREARIQIDNRRRWWIGGIGADQGRSATDLRPKHASQVKRY